MREGAAGVSFRDASSLKIRYRGLAVAMGIFVVSNHQKGRHQRLQKQSETGNGITQKRFCDRQVLSFLWGSKLQASTGSPLVRGADACVVTDGRQKALRFFHQGERRCREM